MMYMKMPHVQQPKWKKDSARMTAVKQATGKHAREPRSDITMQAVYVIEQDVTS